MGFARGFETYLDNSSRRLKTVLQDARRQIERFDDDERYFLFLHAYDVHAPFDPPQRLRQMFETRPREDRVAGFETMARFSKRKLKPGQIHFFSDLYDAEIRAADEKLGSFFDWLEERASWTTPS